MYKPYIKNGILYLSSIPIIDEIRVSPATLGKMHMAEKPEPDFRQPLSLEINISNIQYLRRPSFPKEPDFTQPNPFPIPLF